MYNVHDEFGEVSLLVHTASNLRKNEKLGLLSGMPKRGFEELVVDDGIAAAKAILKLATGNLVQGNRVSDLPYPGIGVPPSRPPVHLAYIGSEFVFDLFENFWSPKTPRLLIEGPSGFGKSSDLRALACSLYRHTAEEKTKDVLVSIWNLNAAVADEVKAVKNALLFAYLVKWEGQLIEPDQARFLEEKDGEGAAEEEEPEATEENKVTEKVQMSASIQEAVDLERKVVTKRIQGIASMQEAVDFVEQRKREEGEVFHFFADGWEVFDSDKGRRLCTREKIQNLLEGLFARGASVTLALSANSTTLDERRSDTHVMTKARPFSEEQYGLYKTLTILGRLDRARAKDIDFYTGRVPWLLGLLLECCNGVGRETVADQRLALIQSLEGKVMRREMVLKQLLGIYPTEDKLAEMLYADDGAWAAVLSMFREKLTVVQKEIDKIELRPGEQCQSMVSMGAKDKSHFIAAEGRYCCGFIERMYTEGFRAKEEADAICREGQPLPSTGRRFEAHRA